MYGPALNGLLKYLSSDHFALGLINRYWKQKNCRKSGCGAANFQTSVFASGVANVGRGVIRVLLTGAASLIWSQVAAMSSMVSGEPSEYLRFGRSFMVYVRPSAET